MTASAQDPSLIDLLGPALVAASLLYAPGFLVLRGLRLPSMTAVAGAPGVGLAVLVTAGALGHLLGTGSSLGPGLATVGVLTALAAALARLLVGRGPRPPRGDRVDPRAALLGCAVAALTFSIAFLQAIGRADAWPQMPDNIFHVNTVVWMARHGSAWLGDVTAYTGAPSFAYPGGWHVLTALVTMWTGADALVASHAVAIVVSGVVWPLTFSLLVWRAVGTSRLVVTAAPFVALLFSGLPWTPLQWGVLWPYLLATTLYPVVVASALLVVSPGRTRHERLVHGMVGCVALGSAAVTHPSALFLAVLTVPPLLLCRLWPALTLARRTLWLLATLLLVLACWSFVNPSMTGPALAQPTFTTEDALEGLLASLSRGLLPAALLLVALVAGCVVAGRRPESRWIVVGVVAALVSVSLLPMAPAVLRALLLWPWFGDYRRLEAPLAIVGGLAICVLVHRTSSRSPRRPLEAVVAALVLTLTVFAVTADASGIRDVYRAAGDTPVWVTNREIDAFRTLAHQIPRGSVVAADPLAGGTQLFRFADITVALPTEKTIIGDPVREPIARSLDRLTTEPDVCRAVRQLNVTYVVSGGAPVRWDIPAETFAGVRSVSPSGGFVEVASAGPYRLWRVPSCTA